jgi:hypothetical protein
MADVRHVESAPIQQGLEQPVAADTQEQNTKLLATNSA